MTPIELLCPAKNLDIAREAINNGADAVYIGGPSFGARAAAGNSVEDIASLCRYAHIFGVRVYVTLNTILYDHELPEVERLIHRLYEAGVDALIVQDLALLKLDLPPIALHASTQMDNCTPEKARFLEAAGFSQIVVARELSLDQIRAIREATTLPIEGFVHGALCVSYSGRCYVSQHCFGRSANRGECAQFCRLSFDLVDADARVISTKHHLSLRDMNRSNSIEQMLDAGVQSFKIEGRLKDAGYVKNVTAHYRQAIDKILARRPQEFVRASYGESHIGFIPQLNKSFNRGFTDYFLHGRSADIWSMQTPKAIGAPVGRVGRVGKRSFVVEDEATFANGDGLCFFDAEGRLQGFRINRAEGDELFPLQVPPGLRPGIELFRNEDRVFEKVLHRSATTRTLSIILTLSEWEEGFRLAAATEHGVSVLLEFRCERTEARTPQQENMTKQLSKFGGTPFEVKSIDFRLRGERFIPSSQLGEWRRDLTSALTEACLQHHVRDVRRPVSPELDLSGCSFDYTANVANQLAAQFLKEHGAEHVAPAYELKEQAGVTLMTCRHCLRYAHGECPRETGRAPRWKEPLALRLPNGRTFPLTFDCAKCEMSVHHD